MTVTAHRRARAGELIAYALPPGDVWLEILAAHASSGASFLPIDVRLSDREQRAVIERARPALLVTPDDEVLFADPAPIDPDRAWAVVATSGVSGRPKLAELPRTALGAAVAGSLTALDASAFDPWVACLSPAHVGGLLVLLRGALAGAPVDVFDGSEPVRLVAEAPDGAHVALVPTMLRRLVANAQDLSRLGVLLVGGSSLDPSLRAAAARLGARVATTYGLTESCGGVVYDGIPFDGTDLRISPTGEIEIAGPTVMEGYRSDPVGTAGAFTVDGWLRTGDLGELDVEGRLVVHGRSDDAIRSGAETVWPDEVEAALRSYPGVADVAVVGAADHEWGQRVVAWVVPADRALPPTLEVLREHCRERLARYKAPRELVLVDALPRTASGKLRRAAFPPASAEPRP
jgi:O-succinylbenzoic acid--CoA ligase